MFTSRRYKKRNRLFFIGVFLLIAFSVLSRIGVFNPIDSLIQRKIIIPLKSQKYAKKRSEVDIAELLEKSLSTASELKAAQLLEENRLMKRMMGLTLKSNPRFVDASVIDFKVDSLTIAKGANQGIKTGMVAIIAQDKPILIGKVAKVSQEVAEIVLPSNRDSRLSTVVISSSNDNGYVRGRGLAIGQGQGSIAVTQIMNQEKIAVGDYAAYLYQDDLLLIGTVSSISTDAGGLFQTALVEPAITPFKLLTVFLFPT